MAEKGLRYIITTADSIYVTPSVRVLKDKNKVLFTNVGTNELSVCECSIDSVISIFREDYTKRDVTEELVPLEEYSVV